jgi:hypothetical protein
VKIHPIYPLSLPEFQDTDVSQAKQKPKATIWRQSNGDPVTCYDKIAVLNQNIKDLRQESQDVLEDALLMGCDEKQVREALEDILTTLNNPFRK